MKSFPRILMTVTLLAATTGLCACNNSADSTVNTAPPVSPAPSPAVTANAAEAITVSRPRIRATAPGQTISGAFMTLSNTSATSYALVSVSFNGAGLAEIHETSMNGEMMQMRKVNQIGIPARGSVELKPGSYHIMLMGLEKSLTAGTTETLVLTFSDNSRKSVEAPVDDLGE